MPRPNILLVTSDQHRGDSLGCAGHPCVRTPHLDKLAAQGLRFDRAFSDCPICIPARTTLITGVKSSTYGCPTYGADFRIDRPREAFLGSLLTAAGYQTCLVGKTHWHTPPHFKAGFETLIPISRCKKQQQLWWRRPGNPLPNGANELNPSRSPLPPELYTTDWCIDRSLEWRAEREHDRPFFLWTSMTDPHPPLAIHEPYYSMYDRSPIPEPAIGDWVDDPERCPAEQREHRLMYNAGPYGPDELRHARGVYYGMITNLDHQLGRLLGYLQQQGLDRDTLVVYTTDHGEHLGDHRDAAKSSFYNAAARIPFIVKPPTDWAWNPGGTSDALVELADLLPTFCELADADIPDDVEGRSLLPLGAGETERIRDVLFGQIDGRHMAHDADHKYIYHTMDGREQCFAADDRDDLQDLAPEQPERCAELRAALVRRLQHVDHDDVSATGDLRDDGRAARPESELRAMNPLGWGAMGRTLG